MFKMRASPTRTSRQSGVALILVIFIVTLASILVVNLAYSTYLNSRVSSGAQRSIQAEYLLKSALALSQVLLDAGGTNFDSMQDLWAKFFYAGAPIPPELLGISEPNVRLSLEIRPADAGLPIKNLNTIDLAQQRMWYTIFSTFFEGMGFETDLDQTDQSGFFPGEHFPPKRLAASLIDYMDKDQDNYSSDSPGEADLPKGSLPGEVITTFSELSRVPGFTPQRIRKILPLISLHGDGLINANFVAGLQSGLVDQVLLSLDGGMRSDNVEQIRSKALSKDPFTSGTDKLLREGLPSIFSQRTFFSARSDYFRVIAEVDYGTSRFFLRAIVRRDNGASPLPVVHSFEIF